MDKIINALLGNGRIDFALLVMLTIYVLRVNGEREKKYQDIISNLTESVSNVDKIEGEVVKLSEKVDKISDNLSKIDFRR